MAYTKTTIDLLDDLLIAAKKRAAEERTTLRQLVARGLRRELAGEETAGRNTGEIRWVVVDGGVPSGVDPADREQMYDWISEES